MADEENVRRTHARSMPGVKPPGPLILNEDAVENWKLFRQKWKNFSILANLNDYGREYQVASLQNALGDHALKVYNGFDFQTEEDERTVEEILLQFDEYIVGELNETYERYLFNKKTQAEDESFDSFLANIRNMVKNCNYCDQCVESNLRDRIVIGVYDKQTQQSLLRERGLTLKKCIDICRTAEQAKAQYAALRPEQIHAMASHKFKRNPKQKTEQKKTSGQMTCKFCGKTHRFVKSECPAWGKTCSKCGLKNHFKVMCPRVTVHTVREEECDEEWVNSIAKKKTKEVKCLLQVENKEVAFQIDTGASINILPEEYLKRTSVITPTKHKLNMWNMTDVSPMGCYTTMVTNPKDEQKYEVEFMVTKENFMPLIGLPTAIKMKLISINEEHIENVSSMLTVDDVYSELWNGKLGNLPGIVHLKTDPTVTPVVMPTKRIPIALREKLKQELDRLEELGVLKPVDEPTPWVNQMAITQKRSGELRICLDPQQLNRALLREHFTLPVLEDTLHELSASRVFSKVDLASGLWHVELDEESSMLTTMQTCYGRYRWLRLPFGLAVSSEIFQKKLLENLHGLTGVVCLADDILIHGKDDNSHDQHLEDLFKRCQERGIKLNKDKLELRLSKITFMGHTITKDGLQVDPEKVRAITEMNAPTNVQELRRFLGMCNYLTKFLPKLTDITAPLRNLTKKDVAWTWSSAQQQAFDLAKERVTEAPILSYYEAEKELVVENDASEYGIGSALLQGGKPVAYSSRSLSDPESRYAQIEKEMLAVVHGLEKFHMYTYGRRVTVVTDHKPLVSIVKKPLSKAPARIQALVLRAQKYDYALISKDGKDIPGADTLSRGSLPDKPQSERVYVNMSFCEINNDKLSEIRSATRDDSELSELSKVIVC